MTSDASHGVATVSGGAGIPGGHSLEEAETSAASAFGSAKLLLAAEHAVDIGAASLRQCRGRTAQAKR
jgi:hypothetical protein